MQIVIQQAAEAFGLSALKHSRVRVLNRLGPFEDVIHAVQIATGPVNSNTGVVMAACQIRLRLAGNESLEVNACDGIVTRAFEQALQKAREQLEARCTTQALDASAW
jgi:hypothetical protein